MLQIIIIVLIVAADLLTKYLLTPLMHQAGGSLPLIPNVLHLTYVENTGASFGIFQNSVVFFIIVTGIVLAAGIAFMIRTRKTQSIFLKISLSLVIGGAMGRPTDRTGGVEQPVGFSSARGYSKRKTQSLRLPRGLSGVVCNPPAPKSSPCT